MPQSIKAALTNLVPNTFVTVTIGRVAGPWVISNDGVGFLKDYEQFSPALYNDDANHATVGFGHLVHLGPIDGSASEAPFVAGISAAQGEALLRTDLSRFESAVNSWVKVPLFQQEYDALVIFAFNIGVGAFGTSTALRKLNAGKYHEVSAAMMLFNRAGGKLSNGLVNRRAEEAEIFDSGDYRRTR